MKAHACRAVIYGIAVLLAVQTRAQQTDTITVHFENNRAAVTDQAITVMERYFLSVQPHFTIQQVKLSGYCDPAGTSHYNDSLSIARVKSIKAWLCSKWIDAATISFEQGFGEKFQLNNNSTAQLRAVNRRVEIILQKRMIDTATPVRDKTVKPIVKDTLYRKIMDSTTHIGTTIVLQRIIFYGGSHIPLPESTAAINELLAAMQTRPQLKIEIDGHICCEASDRDGIDQGTGSRDLSVQRAKYIYDFLLRNGIDSNRMSYKGFGASQKIYPLERNDVEQRLNRRVEIKIISK